MISGKYAGGLIGIIVDNIVDDIEIKFNTIHSPLIQVDNYLGIMVGGAQYWAFSTTEFNYNFSTTEYSELSYNSIGGEIIGHSSASCTSPASSNNVVQNDQGLSSDSCVQVNLLTLANFASYSPSDWQTLLGPGIFETNFAQNSNLENNYPYASQTSEYLFESGTPYVTDVRALEDGTYGLSDTVTIVVSFSEPVNVDTTSTTPSFDLNFCCGTTVSVPYYSGSGNSTLTFLYEVSSQDENSNDLEYPDDTTITAGSNITAVSDSDPIDESFPRKGFGNSLGEMSKIIIDTETPTVTLTDSDLDNNLSKSQTVTITAGFSEAMTATPVISISSVGTYTMTQVSGTNSYTYLWDTSIGSLSSGSYIVTVSGSDLVNNAYSGTDSITFTIGPSVILTTSDSDNLITTGLVTITATFDENMQATPTVSIAGVVTNTAMSLNTSATVWEYRWEVPSSITTGSFEVTVAGTNTSNIPYSGTDSITLKIDPMFYYDTNGITIKCSGCSVNDQGYLDGVLYTAYDNSTLSSKNVSDTDWNRVVTTLVTDMGQLFESEATFNQDISSWDTSSVTNMNRMFYVASDFNQDIGNWDTSNVTGMYWMFFNASSFNQNIDSWDVSNITTMYWMFRGASDFNQPLNSWDVSGVTNMYGMFLEANQFDQSLNSWNTSNVTNMSFMFRRARDFNGDISSWDTSSVTNMQNMFDTATVFNQDISGWDTSEVTNMSSMFNNANAFNQNIGGWDVSKTTNFSRQFNSADVFNQDIGDWDVSRVAVNGWTKCLKQL